MYNSSNKYTGKGLCIKSCYLKKSRKKNTTEAIISDDYHVMHTPRSCIVVCFPKEEKLSEPGFCAFFAHMSLQCLICWICNVMWCNHFCYVHLEEFWMFHGFWGDGTYTKKGKCKQKQRTWLLFFWCGDVMYILDFSFPGFLDFVSVKVV